MHCGSEFYEGNRQEVFCHGKTQDKFATENTEKHGKIKRSLMVLSDAKQSLMVAT